MDDLYTKIEEGIYSIEIKETRRGRFPVLNKGGERTLTKQEDDELRNMMKKYKKTILDLHDINEKYDGNERAWYLGKKMSTVRKDDQAKVGALFKILPMKQFSDSSAYRYRIFYEAFPEGEGKSKKTYDPEHKHAVISELVQRSGSTDKKTKYEIARDVYWRIRDESDLAQDEIRAWSLVDSEDPDLQDVVDAIVDRIQNPTIGNVKTVYKMIGETPPSNEKIRSILENRQ
jgi:hypothetical protein